MFKIYSRYGIWITIVLIVYFLLLKVVGLHDYPTLSALNALIYGFGIYMALNKFRKSGDDFRYDRAFEVGFLSGAIATILFTIFMAIYMYQIDTQFPLTVMERWNLESDLGTLMLVLSILIMGIVTTLILTFTFMQLLKRSWNTKDGNRNVL